MVLAFVKDDPAKAAGLAARIQKLSTTNTKLKAFVVFQGGAELKPTIEKAATANSISIPLTFLARGTSDAALSRFNLNPAAKNTIIIYNRKKVHGTFTDVDEKSFAEVEKAAQQAAGG